MFLLPPEFLVILPFSGALTAVSHVLFSAEPISLSRPSDVRLQLQRRIVAGALAGGNLNSLNQSNVSEGILSLPSRDAHFPT